MIFMDFEDQDFSIIQFGYQEQFTLTLRYKLYINEDSEQDVKEVSFLMRPIREQLVPLDISDWPKGTYSMDWSVSDSVYEFMILECGGPINLGRARGN